MTSFVVIPVDKSTKLDRINICFLEIYKLDPLSLADEYKKDGKMIPMREENNRKKGQINFQMNNFLRVIQLDLILFKSPHRVLQKRKFLRYFFLWWWNCFSKHESNIFLLYIPEKRGWNSLCHFLLKRFTAFRMLRFH